MTNDRQEIDRSDVIHWQIQSQSATYQPALLALIAWRRGQVIENKRKEQKSE